MITIIIVIHFIEKLLSSHSRTLSEKNIKKQKSLINNIQKGLLPYLEVGGVQPSNRSLWLFLIVALLCNV